jgi:hypothetical protein
VRRRAVVEEDLGDVDRVSGGAGKERGTRVVRIHRWPAMEREERKNVDEVTTLGTAHFGHVVLVRIAGQLDEPSRKDSASLQFGPCVVMRVVIGGL